MLGCVAIGGGQNELGARQRREVLRAFLAVGLRQFGEGMDAENEGSAESPCGLQAVLDCRQAVQRMDLVEEEPGAQRARARQAHQRVHCQVHPEREQCAVEDEFVVRGGDEQDAARLVIVADPRLNRKGLLALRQEAQRLGIGVEHGPDRLCHLGRFGRSQGIGDGVFEHLVDLLEVRHHQPAGERLVGRLAILDELDAGLDKQRARSEHPERLGPAAIGRKQGCGDTGKIGMVLRLAEHRPGRATLIHRVEDHVGLGIVERLDVGTGEVEDDGAIAAHTHLGNQRAHLGGLAGPGRANHHRVRLFGTPGEGDPGERIGVVNAGRFARGKRHRHDLVEAHVGKPLGNFLFERSPVVGIDDACQLCAVDQHCTALVTLFEDRLAAPLREVDEPDGERYGEEQRDEQRAPDRAHHPVPGDGNIGV